MNFQELAVYQEMMLLWGQFAPLAAEYVFAGLRALLILVIGTWLARRLSSYLSKGLEKISHLDKTIKTLLPVVVRYAIWVITLIVTLAQLGVQTASIIAILGAAGLAIGLALQGTLQNIAAGIMLLLLRPFRVGDYIQAGGIEGTVKQIGLFNVEMLSYTGQYMAVPNSNLWNVTIVNFSTHPTARIDIDISIAYEDDIDGALAVISQLAAEDKQILKTPAPQFLVVALAASGVDLRLRCWVNSGDQWAMMFKLRRELKYRIEAAGFTIPYPQRVIHTNSSTQKDTE